MALTNRPRVAIRGRWPNPITLRRGWARAEARQWNDEFGDANLRMVRGGAAFLGACTEVITDLGVAAILSPPLPASAHRTWSAAGYEVFVELALMRLDLALKLPTESHIVAEIDIEDLDRMLEIDAAAFDSFWRFDRNGLLESIEATEQSRLLAIRGPDGVAAGFAIVGLGHAIAYLQRVAVHPDWQGHGMGRSLIRCAARRAQKAGSRAMLLNTQFDNEPAIALYESEGYDLLPDPLALLRYVPPTTV